MNPTTQDRIKGIIYGQAIGDALGLGTEFLSKQEIKETYPDGYNDYSQIIQDKHRKRWKAGKWTDDTDQFLCIMDSLIEQKEVNILDIASRFKQWQEVDGMGIGYTTYQVLAFSDYEQKPHEASELVWKLKKKDIAPNGGLMRNSIVCTFRYWDIEQVLDNCESICKLTHYDPRCYDCCKLMAHIITGELNDNPLSWNDFYKLLADYDPRIKEYLNDPCADISKLKLDDANSVGYTLKALNAAVWSYYNATDFEEALLGIIMEGGDADTNGCIVASILGAKFGYQAIPQRWIDGLIDKELLDNRIRAYCI